jgi:hypothetical protein
MAQVQRQLFSEPLFATSEIPDFQGLAVAVFGTDFRTPGIVRTDSERLHVG